MLARMRNKKAARGKRVYSGLTVVLVIENDDGAAVG